MAGLLQPVTVVKAAMKPSTKATPWAKVSQRLSRLSPLLDTERALRPRLSPTPGLGTREGGGVQRERRGRTEQLVLRAPARQRDPHFDGAPEIGHRRGHRGSDDEGGRHRQRMEERAVRQRPPLTGANIDVGYFDCGTTGIGRPCSA